MPKVVVYEGVAFNADWAASKKVNEFIEHEKHHGLSKEQLTEAHNLCKTAMAPAKEATQEPAAEPKP